MFSLQGKLQVELVKMDTGASRLWDWLARKSRPLAMHIQGFTCNPFQTNCYVCHSEGEGVLIDASCSTPEECAEVERYIAEHGLTIRRLLLTHGHIDHILGCAHFARTFGMGFWMHRDDQAFILQAEEQARVFGTWIEKPPAPEDFLGEGDRVSFGGASLEVLHTPGHSPGSIAFYHADSQAVISGDVLFQGSIGRTDLWRGSLPELMQSIFGKILALGDAVRVYPGHGPDTTAGIERQTNPFLLSAP